MRSADLFVLTWESVDFERGLIYEPNSKTGRNYSVRMKPLRERERNWLRFSKHLNTETYGNNLVHVKNYKDREDLLLHDDIPLIAGSLVPKATAARVKQKLNKTTGQ